MPLSSTEDDGKGGHPTKVSGFGELTTKCHVAANSMSNTTFSTFLQSIKSSRLKHHLIKFQQHDTYFSGEGLVSGNTT